MLSLIIYGFQVVQNLPLDVLKSNVNCSCSLMLCVLLHPVRHLRLIPASQAKAEAFAGSKSFNMMPTVSQNPSQSWRVLNSSDVIYFRLHSLMAFASCEMLSLIRTVSSCGWGAALRMESKNHRQKSQSSLILSSGADSAEETDVPFLSTATVGKITRRAWALLTFMAVVTAQSLANKPRHCF